MDLTRRDPVERKERARKDVKTLGLPCHVSVFFFTDTLSPNPYGGVPPVDVVPGDTL